MLDDKAVRVFERQQEKKDSNFKKNKCKPRPKSTEIRQRLVDGALEFMRMNQGLMPTMEEIAATARLGKVTAYKYTPKTSSVRGERQKVILAEALKNDYVAAEIGALIVKRKGIKAPCAEPYPWEETTVWKWWRTVLIGFARPT